MIVKKYTNQDFHQWNDFIKTSKNGLFLFDRNYMDYHSDRFQDHSLMIYDTNHKLLAVLPANQVDETLYSHQGLTFGGFIYGKKIQASQMKEVISALKTYCQKNTIHKIIYKAVPYFYHTQPAQEDIYVLFQEGAKLSRVDISSTIDMKQTRYAFSSGRKAGLKKADSCNFTIHQTDNCEPFFNMLSSLLEEKYQARPTHTANEMKLLQSRFPNNIRIYGCYHEDEMVAGVIMYEYAHVAHTQYIGTNAFGRENGALDYLLNGLINEVYKDFHYFDFGISTEDGGRKLNEALIQQKEGFGARSTVHQFFELEI